MAITPPMGPVFIALPMDVLDAPNEESIVPVSVPVTRVTPPSDLIAEAASMLATARNPMIIMGDGVSYSEATAELTRVAELSGAEVWGANSSEVNISASHPLFRGQLGHMFGDHSQPIVSQADTVLICGTYLFPEVFPTLTEVFAPHTKVIHIDLDAYEVAKNFPVDLGLICDPKVTLAQLSIALEAIMTGEQRAAANERIRACAAKKQHEITTQYELDKTRSDALPLHASVFMRELASRLPKDAVIFDEALTVSPDLVNHIPPDLPGHYFLTRGGSLGVGVPGAIGLKLAHPEKTVIGFSGDGGSMYTFQALWTAAHHKIGAKFVICNNRSYQILKLNIQQYWKERQMEEHGFPASFTLDNPEIRFDELALALGVKATRVEYPQQIDAAIAMALADDEPFLIDLVLTNDIPDHMIHKAVYKYGSA